MTLIVIHLLLAFAWTAITGVFTLANLALGFAIAWGSLYLIRDHSGVVAYVSRTRRAIGLAALFVIELIKSAWGVALVVARPRMNLRPGIVAYPLRVESDAEIT